MSDDQYTYIEYFKNGKLNYVSIAGIIINTEEYDDVIKTRYHYLVSKNGKIGALNGEGVSIAPCIYEKIVSNRRGELIVTLDGKEEVLNPIPNIGDDNDYEYQRPTYGRYAGSYAQDEFKDPCNKDQFHGGKSRMDWHLSTLVGIQPYITTHYDYKMRRSKKTNGHSFPLVLFDFQSLLSYK